jgi:hypothetical protein
MTGVAQAEQSTQWKIALAPYTVCVRSGRAIYTPIDVLNLAKTHIGSFVVQDYIRKASLCDLRRIMRAMHSFCSEDLFIHVNAHHVFIKIVHTCPRSIWDLVPLIEHPLRVACHKYGCRVVIAIIQFYQGLDSFLLPIMQRILYVSADTYGKHVLQAIIEHDACSSYKQAILCLIQKHPGQFMTYSRMDVLSAALIYATPEQKREIATCVLHTDAFASIIQSRKPMRVCCRALICSTLGV